MSGNTPENIAIKARRKNGKVHVTITFDAQEDRWFKKDEIIARMNITKGWLLRHLYTWADFDHSYSIELFKDALENLGKGLIRWDHAVLGKRNGRRAIRASKMLDQAYFKEYYESKSYENWRKRSTMQWRPLKNGMSQMYYNYLYDNAMGMDKKEYSDKMFKLIHKREERIKLKQKINVWKFIHKYIEHWWD
jgi:hypothetical protein